MKTLVTVLSAIALLGTVSAASAAPNAEEFGSLAWWEQQNKN
ncbi:hypothetical protein [Dichotomicrobium thermohalophilum]|uniref:Uncharacterized protein n=1 Tax=Dichotomicrobium thermohalophilum TaxID=933063 RepID=A0A397Q2C4_9HYPH|nr:hypothetical protein [Dichotomicrobium thermohalophilum]RIA55302.1 hypothetical protein BXY53_0363 [Dichotomicrobium thermohalophilum]